MCFWQLFLQGKQANNISSNIYSNYCYNCGTKLILHFQQQFEELNELCIVLILHKWTICGTKWTLHHVGTSVVHVKGIWHVYAVYILCKCKSFTLTHCKKYFINLHLYIGHLKKIRVTLTWPPVFCWDYVKSM